MNYWQKAIDLIKQFEGCKLEAYKDVVGIWTIGYGQTGKEICEGLKISQEEADAWLESEIHLIDSDLVRFFDEAAREEYNLKFHDLSYNQQCAIISLVYNIGIMNFKHSTLFKKLMSNAPIDEVANEFPRWNKAGGKEFEGLTRRRNAERELFLS